MLPSMTNTAIALAALLRLVSAGRQPYDVHKIIDAFRQPREDLVILCAHRGLRWNGTTENSRDAYFRATEAGLECIETDIRISADGQLPMIHDAGLGRETDVGEQTGQAAYNPFTGEGYSPGVLGLNFTGFIENLHLRDEGGRVHIETVPTLPQMVESIRDSGANVVLQLDFKDQNAVEPAYWQLKHLTNAAGVPANEWSIYKLQASWWKTPEEFEAEPWVQDAFASGIQLAYLPVYQPQDVGVWDVMGGLKAFMATNYTISAELELRSSGGPLQDLVDYVNSADTPGATFNTSGLFFAIGDLVDPISSKFYPTANYSLPDDERVNDTAYVYQDGRAPVLLDSLVSNYSIDGHDYRSDFDWILRQGFNWVITDTPDLWNDRLQLAGRRNISHMIADGKHPLQQPVARGWYV